MMEWMEFWMMEDGTLRGVLVYENLENVGKLRDKQKSLRSQVDIQSRERGK